MTDATRRPQCGPRLHHVALGARDVERVAAFYRDLLGLTELRRHQPPEGGVRSIWLDLGGPILMVERTEAPLRRIDGVGTGPFLIALAAGSATRVALEEALARAGSPVESRTAHTIYFRDPEGNRVAISAFSI